MSNIKKVRILDRCKFCDGEGYVYLCEMLMAWDIALIEPNPVDWAEWVSYLLERLEFKAERRGSALILRSCEALCVWK